MEMFKNKAAALKKPFFYLTVGGLAVVIDAGLFFILHAFLQWPVIIALPVSFGCGLLTSFILNKIFVFAAHAQHHSTKKQAVLYGALVIFNLLFQYVFIVSLVRFGYDATLGKIIATALTAGWNFFIYRAVIFK